MLTLCQHLVISVIHRFAFRRFYVSTAAYAVTVFYFNYFIILFHTEKIKGILRKTGTPAAFYHKNEPKTKQISVIYT